MILFALMVLFLGIGICVKSLSLSVRMLLCVLIVGALVYLYLT
jgi:hypothetical protein